MCSHSVSNSYKTLINWSRGQHSYMLRYYKLYREEVKQMKDFIFFFKSELKLFVLQVPHWPQSITKQNVLLKFGLPLIWKTASFTQRSTPRSNFLSSVIPLNNFCPCGFFLFTPHGIFFFLFLLKCISCWRTFEGWCTEQAAPGFIKPLCFNTVFTITHLKPFPITNKLAPDKSFVWLVKGGKYARNKWLRLPGWWNLVN